MTLDLQTYRRLPRMGALLAVWAGTALAAPAAKPPNFILILGEGVGWSGTSVQMDDREPASLGNAVKTPGLERLATAGMRFARGYAASPRCTPSRAALFTGRSPAALRMTFVNDGSRDAAANTRLVPARTSLELSLDETTVGELLKGRGYATAHFGKWHVGRENPSRHGFDESDGATGNGGPDNVSDPNPKQAVQMTARGIDFMERQSRAGRPFYLQLSHYPSQPERRGENRNVDGHMKELAATDQSVGAILDAVERLGIRGNTYFVYTADHGSQGRNLPLSGGKGGVWEGGIRVPFIVTGPGIAANSCSHVRVSATDLLPTFAELAGATEPLPKQVEGGSITPLLRGRGDGAVRRPHPEYVVHFPHYDKDPLGPATALIDGNDKLIRFYETGSHRLFDLAQDPGERNDLAPQRAARVSELSRRLDDYLQGVGAQLPGPNPSFDPARPTSNPERGGGRGKRRPEKKEADPC